MTERPLLLVCVNRRLDAGKPSCAGRGSEALADRLETLISERGLALELRRILCFGDCARGPNLRLAPGGRFFHGADPASAEEILEQIQSTPPDGAG